MTSIGPAIREIRIREKDGTYRVVYVANLPDVVFVLHCFQKKTQKTSSRDIEIVRRRYKELLRELRR